MRQQKMVIVGTSKPVLNYVTACITIFNSGARRVRIRARGKAINVAVEVVQLLRSRFIRDIVIVAASVDRDVVAGRDGRAFSVPVLELDLARELKGVNDSKRGL